MSRERLSSLEQYADQESSSKETKKQTEQMLWDQKRGIEQEVNSLEDGIVDESALQNIRARLEAWLQNLREIAPDQEQNIQTVGAFLSRAKTKKNLEDVLSSFRRTEEEEEPGKEPPRSTGGEDKDAKRLEAFRRSLKGMEDNYEMTKEALDNQRIAEDDFLERLASTYGQLLEMSEGMPKDLKKQAETLVDDLKKEYEDRGITEFILPQRGEVITDEDVRRNKYIPKVDTTDEETMQVVKKVGKKNCEMVIDGIYSIGYKKSNQGYLLGASCFRGRGSKTSGRKNHRRKNERAVGAF